MLRSDLCDYSDAYIAVEGIVTVEGTDDANKRNKKLVLKNNALFNMHIKKISNRSTDNAQDLDVI